jgi:hypothetical protein
VIGVIVVVRQTQRGVQRLCSLHQLHHAVISADALVNHVHSRISRVFALKLPTPEMHQLWRAICQRIHIADHLFATLKGCGRLWELRLIGPDPIDEFVVVEVIRDARRSGTNQLRSIDPAKGSTSSGRLQEVQPASRFLIHDKVRCRLVTAAPRRSAAKVHVVTSGSIDSKHLRRSQTRSPIRGRTCDRQQRPIHEGCRLLHTNRPRVAGHNHRKNSIDLSPEGVQPQLPSLGLAQCDNVAASIPMRQPGVAFVFIDAHEGRHRDRDQLKSIVFPDVFQRHVNTVGLDRIAHREISPGSVRRIHRSKVEVDAAF